MADQDTNVGPIAVFDAGLGSYDIVRTLRSHFPAVDLIYFADRASFPYGAKSASELFEVALRSCQYLNSLGADCVIIGSNAPSVTVLDAVAAQCAFPVLGVLPPIQVALSSLEPMEVLLLAGAAAMTQSQQLQAFINREAGQQAWRVQTAAATKLIDLVESGQFVADPSGTVALVAEFLDQQRREGQTIGGVSLSSTHLPWLSFAFKEAAPNLQLFNPSDSVALTATPYAGSRGGSTVSLVTETPQLTAQDFAQTLDRLGIELELTVVPALG